MVSAKNRNRFITLFPRVAFLTRGYPYLTTTWSVAAEIHNFYPFSLRFCVRQLLLPQRKQRYRNGRKGGYSDFASELT